MLFLKEIGLDCFSEEENFNLLANYVLRKGKPFYGYQGFYIYHSLGYAEIIAHVIPNEERQVNECIGFSSHVMGNNFWRLTIAEDGVMDDEGDSLSKCVFFHNPELENCVFPVHLVHADVLPSFMPGEKVTMQIQAFPYEIEYFKDEESYRAKHGVKMMGKFVDVKDGNILNMRIDDGCLIKATVKHVKRLDTFDVEGNAQTFLAVTVETPYGDLSLCHREDAVDADQKEFIKEDSIVRTLCVLSGDVAVGEYQDGAVFDEEHALKVLREALTNGDFSRCHNLFADDVKYVGMDGEIKHDSKAECLKYLNDTAAKIGNRNVYVYHATVLGETDNMPKVSYEEGKRVLLVSYDTPATFTQILALEMNEDNEVAKLIMQDCRHYKIEIDMDENWERNEITAINVLKESLDSGDASKMINLVSEDAWFVHGDSITARFGFGVVYMLDRIIEEVNKHDGVMNTHFVEITGYKNKERIPQLMPGKLCLALSVGDLEQYEQIMAVQLNSAGEISAIQIVEDNDYEIKSVDPDDEICKTYAEAVRWKPVQTERSKEEWLELLRDWFNGNGEEDCEMIFYSGMLPDCELKLDNGDYISTLNDKESIFANIEVFANLPYKEIAVVKEIDKASILTMGPMRLTITTSEQGRIEEIDIYAPEM